MKGGATKKDSAVFGFDGLVIFGVLAVLGLVADTIWLAVAAVAGTILLARHAGPEWVLETGWKEQGDLDDDHGKIHVLPRRDARKAS